MTPRINQIIDTVIGTEGGYVNNPHDRGGPTRWGITEATARSYGYKGDMRQLPRETAFDIYLGEYVVKPKFDRVAQIDTYIAEELIDTGVNMGVKVASEFLQTCLNVFNRSHRGQPDYPEVVVDGAVGEKTLTSLEGYLKIRAKEGRDVMLTALNSLQGARYISIAQGRPQNEEFVYGWMRTRVVIRKECV